MKIKDITGIQCRIGGINNFSVSFQTADRRYHVWVNREGQPHSDDLHSNPPKGTPYARSGPNAHRLLSISAKANAEVVAHVLNHAIGTGMIPLAEEAEKNHKVDVDHRNSVAEYHAYLAVVRAHPALADLADTLTATQLTDIGRAFRRADYTHERY